VKYTVVLIPLKHFDSSILGVETAFPVNEFETDCELPTVCCFAAAFTLTIIF